MNNRNCIINTYILNNPAVQGPSPPNIVGIGHYFKMFYCFYLIKCLLPVWTVSPVAGHQWSGVWVESRVGSWQTGLVFRLVHRERWEVRCSHHSWTDDLPLHLSLYIMVTVVFLQQWCACGVQWLKRLSHSAVSWRSQSNCCVSVESSRLWSLDLSV